MTIDDLKFDEHGFIPAVIQEADTGELMMVAWMDRPAVEATLSTGVTHFWSRSRGVPWRKGETSGHTQHVRRIYVDCDADTLLVHVHQDGVACHTGNRTCFFRALSLIEGNPGRVPPAPPAVPPATLRAATPATGDEAPAANMLARLEAIVESRKSASPAHSYVAGLLAKGEAAICRKVGEEAVEVVTAALGGEGDRRLVEELADLWFHTIVLLGERGIPLHDVLKELARRHAGRDGSAG